MGGGNCLKYLKRRWNRKEGRGNKDFKKSWKAGSRGGCLKTEGSGIPLRTMFTTRSHPATMKRKVLFIVEISLTDLHIISMEVPLNGFLRVLKSWPVVNPTCFISSFISSNFIELLTRS